MKWLFRRETLVMFLNNEWSDSIDNKLRLTKAHFDKLDPEDFFEVDFTPEEKVEIVKVLGLVDVEAEMNRKPN